MKTLKQFFFTKSLIILLISVIGCDQPMNGQNNSETTIETKEVVYLKVSPNEFRSEMQAETGDYYLIDVRTEGEFAAGAIENAENFDIMNGDFQKKLKELDPKTPVYVYCAKGGRSSQAAQLLEENGFERIIELKGGYSAWK